MGKPRPPEGSGGLASIRPRAYVVGAVLLAGLLALTPYNDYFIRGSYMANHHVPVAASFVLLLLCLTQTGTYPIFRRHDPLRGRAENGIRPYFLRSELAVIWAMLAVSSGLASAGLMRFLIPTLPALRFFATPENRWEETLWPHIPAWFVPTDEDAVRWFYDGAPPGAGVPWGAWLGPIATWTAVALLIFTVHLCLAGLLRKQWVEHERMTFVHVQLPLALIEPPQPGRRLNTFLGDRLMWLGFALPFILYGLAGLANYYPAVPRVRILYPNFYSHPLRFEARPWNAASGILVALFPSSIGFGFLLTTEVSLSAWVFFVLFKLQAVLMSALGLQLRTVTSGYGSKQFTAYQDMGVYLALVGTALWTARRHLRGLWSQALGREVAVLAAATLLLLLTFSQAGMSHSVALAFFAAYFMICTGLSWLTSNTGVLQLPVVFRPEDYMICCMGTRNLRPADLALLAIPSRAFTFYYNEMLMPHFLNNYKLAAETDTIRRVIVFAQIGAVLLGVVVAWIAHLTLVYSKGAYALQNMSFVDWPRTPFQVAATYITQPSGPDPLSFVFISLGAAAFTTVSALRNGLAWWPLHPAGLLLGSTMEEMWLSLLVAWACKTLILRYGGPRLYHRARVFFLGLPMGEATIACVWIAIGLVTKTGVRLLP